MAHKTFYFDGYSFNPDTKTLALRYSLNDAIAFTETFIFDFDFLPSYDKIILDNAFQGLFIAAGISYFKTYVPREIRFRTVRIAPAQKEFFEKLYLLGLGEFFYKNNIDPNGKINFILSEDATHAVSLPAPDLDGTLVSLSGGKDSLVAAEILKSQAVDFETWTLGEYPFMAGMASKIGKPHSVVKRTLSPNLARLNESGALNGHIPISSIIAFAGVCATILKGKKNIIVAEGASSREQNMVFKGIPINHQYSKTLAFEKDFQEYVHSFVSPSIDYFSFVRPFSEIMIAKLFCARSFEEYGDNFSSCNQNFSMTSKNEKMSWCGKCPKCASTFALFSPFLPKEKLIHLFGGRNLFADPELVATWRELLGISGVKPFECVGETMEIRTVISLAKKTGNYPELDHLSFENPDFNWQEFGEHSMPEHFSEILKSFMNK